MKLHHEILPSIVEALHFFGPLTPTEMVEKLKLRGEEFTVEEIAITCRKETGDRPGGRACIKLANFPANYITRMEHQTYKL